MSGAKRHLVEQLAGGPEVEAAKGHGPTLPRIGGGRAEIHDLMRELSIPEGPPPPRHSALIVVARAGLCVLGPNEGRWLSAWKYSNHLTNAFSGGIVLVTEHGWVDFRSDTAGHSPALAA